MLSENDIIWKRAQFLAQRSQITELRSMTLLIMYDLAMPLNCAGFDYIKNVVPLALIRPSQIVLKELFLEVGAHYDPKVGYSIMDTAVRDVIRMSWNGVRRERWNYYFPSYMLQRNKPPSNAEFIAGMVYFLEMWQGCCKEVNHAE